ncbi:MAG: tryptophan--tRNA ligase, partial [Deinococcus sp.]|nr:tryptophan--tRNA ligase [Deinococcus sp.]
ELVETLKREYSRAGIGTLAVKQILFDQMMKASEPIREKARWLRENPDYVRDGLEAGARRARTIAKATMEEVREKIGLLRPRSVGSA